MVKGRPAVAGTTPLQHCGVDGRELELALELRRRL
jgi:hypothetical protein